MYYDISFCPQVQSKEQGKIVEYQQMNLIKPN